MRAAVLENWDGDLSVESVPKPEPAPGDVRVAVRACGVTRTVENAVQGGLSGDDSHLPRIPGHEFAGGAVAADGLATPLRICERAGVSDDDVVLVVGAAGRVGVHLAQLAEARGARVLAADVREDRLDHVAAHTGSGVVPVDVSGPDVTETIRSATPHREGPTVAVDTVGDLEVLRAAWDALAMGGRLVTLTTHHERSFAPDLAEFVVKEAEFVGNRYASRDQAVRAARLLADGRVDPVVRGTVGLDGLAAVHGALRSGDTHGMTVLEPGA